MGKNWDEMGVSKFCSQNIGGWIISKWKGGAFYVYKSIKFSCCGLVEKTEWGMLY